MIIGKRIKLRPVQEQDWPVIEEWGQSKEAFWGPFQRFQLDHLPLLRQAYQKTGLLQRDSALLLVETLTIEKVIGFVRYTFIPYPDSDLPHPEIGFGIPVETDQGRGYAQEAVRMLVDYLFSGYPVERIGAFTDVENIPAQKVMAGCGFQQEGTLRRAMFRDGAWRDIAIFALLRQEWAAGE